MDAVGDERGQVALLAAALIAIGVVVIVGLREAEARIVTHASEVRASEAAVEAATAVIADAYVAELRARADPSYAPRDLHQVVTAPAVTQSARDAADAVSDRNSGPHVDTLTVACVGRAVEVAIRMRDVEYRAGFAGQC